MAEVLTQSEIDELLRAMAAGDPETPSKQDDASEQQIRMHDFKLANKFSKEQLRTLDIVYDNFAQSMGNYLAGALRTLCDVKVLSVEEVRFRDFNAALPDPVILAVLNLPPMLGSSILQVSPQIAYAVISHIFGGQDALAKVNKPFSEIDLAAITRIIRQLITRMGEAWGRVATITPSLDRIETSPQFAQIVSVNDAVAIITLQVTIGKVEDFVSICIPHVSIEPIAQMLSTRFLYSSSLGKEIEPQTELLRDRVMASRVNLHAVFRNTTATVRDVVGLQVGDVIRLDHKVSEPLGVKVEHLHKFEGYMGTMGKNYAIRVTEVVKEEADDE